MSRIRANHIQTIALLALGALGVALALGWRVHRHPPAEATRAQLELRQDRLYRPGDTAPFSGWLIEQAPNGTLQSRSQIVAGKLEGLSEGWFTNGLKQVEEHFVSGVSHGLRTKWHENGRKLSEAPIVHGQIDGLFRRWYEDGSLAEEIPMRANQPDGTARAFYPSGYVKAEARLEKGVLLERHAWKDGEQPGALVASAAPGSH